MKNKTQANKKEKSIKSNCEPINIFQEIESLLRFYLDGKYDCANCKWADDKVPCKKIDDSKKALCVYNPDGIYIRSCISKALIPFLYFLQDPVYIDMYAFKKLAVNKIQNIYDEHQSLHKEFDRYKTGNHESNN